MNKELLKCLEYCKEQNGRDDCKNCGLDMEMIKRAEQEMMERVVELIKSRKPNEYAVRKYKTVEARTWDEKTLVIEALDDLLSSLDKEINIK